jgi:hypothetical protein
VLVLALDISPYEFACDGAHAGIPHFWNVLTNVPFVLLGLWQLWRIRRLRAAGTSVSFNWTGLWLSTIGIGLGSGAYHWLLTPLGLALDRLAIAALIAFLLAHAADVTLGWGPSRRGSTLLLAACLSTVVLWMLGGTAWVYGALQALGAVAVLAAFVRADLRARRGGAALPISPRPLYLFTACYGLAKVCEILDQQVCDLTGWIGGHPLKHLWAALGLLFLSALMGQRRSAPKAGGNAATGGGSGGEPA